jgi:hypothetical protein
VQTKQSARQIKIDGNGRCRTTPFLPRGGEQAATLELKFHGQPFVYNCGPSQGRPTHSQTAGKGAPLSNRSPCWQREQLPQSSSALKDVCLLETRAAGCKIGWSVQGQTQGGPRETANKQEVVREKATVSPPRRARAACRLLLHSAAQEAAFDRKRGHVSLARMPHYQNADSRKSNMRCGAVPELCVCVGVKSSCGRRQASDKQPLTKA